jgi:hypothetical protein
MDGLAGNSGFIAAIVYRMSLFDHLAQFTEGAD